MLRPWRGSEPPRLEQAETIVRSRNGAKLEAIWTCPHFRASPHSAFTEVSLRLAAMASVGALRLAFDALSREGGARPVALLLNEVFDALEAGI